MKLPLAKSYRFLERHAKVVVVTQAHNQYLPFSSIRVVILSLLRTFELLQAMRHPEIEEYAQQKLATVAMSVIT